MSSGFPRYALFTKSISARMLRAMATMSALPSARSFGSGNIRDIPDARHGYIELIVHNGSSRNIQAAILRIPGHHVLHVHWIENPATRQVGVIDIGRSSLEKRYNIFEFDAAVHVFILADSEVDRHIVAYRLPNLSDKLQRKSHPFSGEPP